MLNSTDRAASNGYSAGMSSEPFVDDGLTERWAAWQARGVENDRRSRRKLFIITALVVISAAILYGIGWM